MKGGGLGRVAAALREGDWLRAAIFTSRKIRLVQIDRVLILSTDVHVERPLLRKLREREKELTVREAVAGDLPLLRGAFRHNVEKFAGRFSRGDLCLLVEQGGRPAAIGWVRLDLTAGVDEMGCRLELPEGSSWGHDTFVLPEFRNRGAFAVLMDEMFARLRAEGARSLLASVTWENRASRSSHERLGYTTALVLDRLTLFGLRFYRVAPNGRPPTWVGGSRSRGPAAWRMA